MIWKRKPQQQPREQHPDDAQIKHMRKMLAKKAERAGTPTPANENISVFDAANRSDAHGYDIGNMVALELHARGKLATLTRPPDIPDAPEGMMETAWKRGWKRGFDHICIMKLTIAE